MRILPFIFAATFIACSVKAQQTQPPPQPPQQQAVTLDQIFSPQEQQKAGLQKLTAAERENLRQLMIAKFIEAIRMGQANPVQPNAAQQRPVAPNAVAPGAGIYAGVGGGHWIKENIDRGSMFLLEDGSLWEVARLDRLNGSLWLRMSTITVVEAKDGVLGFNYLLVNTNDGETVHAKYLGKK